MMRRKEFSVASKQNAPQRPPGSTGKAPESGSHFAKFVVGSVAIGAAVVAAYQTGYLGQINIKGERSSHESTTFDADNKVSKDVEGLGEQVVVPNNQEEPSRSSTYVEQVEKNKEAHLDLPHLQDQSKTECESQVQGGLHVTPEHDNVPVQQKELPIFSQSSMTSDDHTHSETSTEASLDTQEMGSSFNNMKTSMEQNEGATDAPISQKIEEKTISEESETKATPSNLTSEDMLEGSVVNDAEPPNSLLDTYCLREKDEGSPEISLDAEGADVFVSSSKEKEDAYISKDGKLVLDFLEAIHAAEKRQAELDARIFAEEKRVLKEKYEKELKDARARELMYAEEAAILDKELNKERVKAVATVKLLQEKAEENLKMELERKENEAELQMNKIQELAKAELAAAIASEKASQIEKMAEANLHINALCMAFYARSEEARQSHSVHKLALGALALEDALSKGLPIQTEIDALHTYLEGIDRDSLLDLALSSLPEETLNYGTDTQLQLNQKFDALKGMLRHYSFIPPGGGGILAHSLAHIASGLKMREDDQSGDGIESVINRVDIFLAEGKLAEAADALEGGVSGSLAEEIIGDWVRQVRNRAITEQALSLLQSYATSISLT